MKLIQNKIAALLSGFVLIGIYYAIFVRFFPNAQGRLGEDFEEFFPALLDGYYWYSKNGFLKIPWFTPSFCGGIPNFPDPQNNFYSFPQLLTVFFDPLQSIKITLLFFSAIGFFGFFLLLRSVFLTSMTSATLGACLFLFNGFFVHRLIIGHLTFHSFMLIPLIIFFTLKPSLNSAKKFILDSLIIAFFLSYMFYTGAFLLMPPLFVILVLNVLIYGILVKKNIQIRVYFFKLTFSLIIAVSLSSSKLAAVYSYLKNFPRDDYPLPGIPDLTALIKIITSSVFFMPLPEFADKMIVNSKWIFDRHEYEFGITIVPLIILSIALVSHLVNVLSKKKKCFDYSQVFKISLIAFLLFIPIALNYFSPSWNSFLKKIPILKSSSSHLRWIIIYIPTLILLTSISIEKTAVLHKYRLPIAAASIIVVVVSNLLTDRSYYNSQTYDHRSVVKAYNKVKRGGWKAEITDISISLDSFGNPARFVNRNNALTKGYSQILCQEPIFGYLLEKMPLKTLHPGPVMEETEDFLNIKNPACYVFPNQNGCMPGDHFRKNQLTMAKKFVTFLAFDFHISKLQKIANCITIITLSLYILFIILVVVRKIRIFFIRI